MGVAKHSSHALELIPPIKELGQILQDSMFNATDSLHASGLYATQWLPFISKNVLAQLWINFVHVRPYIAPRLITCTVSR